VRDNQQSHSFIVRVIAVYRDGFPHHPNSVARFDCNSELSRATGRDLLPGKEIAGASSSGLYFFYQERCSTDIPEFKNIPGGCSLFQRSPVMLGFIKVNPRLAAPEGEEQENT